MDPERGSTSLPDLIYQWEEGAENLENYRPGGYHPTHIGDEFHQGRYRVLHKLGHGTYSLVWLARDLHRNKCVALKVLVAGASYKSKESEILRVLNSGNADHPGRPFVSSLLDEFFVEGPNGRHLCIVTEAAGCSVAQSKETSDIWMFPLDTARSISAQCLLGLEYIHSCGIIHADLHSNNVLLKLPDFSDCTDQELYDRFGEPEELPVTRLDEQPTGPEAPRYCVPPALVFVPSDEVKDASIIISDFGESFLTSEERTDLHTPMLLLPPELFFREHLGQPVDVWTMGCTLYEILGERGLFEGFVPDQDDVTAEMVSTLGLLPKKWWDAWEKRGDFFLEDGTWRQDMERIHQPKSRPLRQRLYEMGRGEDPETCQISPEEIESLEKLLRGMLAYDPSVRISASEAVKSEWMEKWALPCLK